MYYDALCQSLKSLLTSSAGFGFGKVLITDTYGLRLLSSYVSFTELLGLGYLDVVLLGEGGAAIRSSVQPPFAGGVNTSLEVRGCKFHSALAQLQVVVLARNVSLVENEILNLPVSIESFDLILLCRCNSRLIQRLVRKDSEKKSKINRLLELTIDYCCHPNRVFSSLLDSGSSLSKLPQDWSTEDFNVVNETIEVLINICCHAEAYFDDPTCKSLPDHVSGGGFRPSGERTLPNFVYSRSSKAADTLVKMLNDEWNQRFTSPSTLNASGGLSTAVAGQPFGGGTGAPSSASAKKCSKTMLVLLDRCEDPVVPLLLPWTYLAMIHEYLNMDNGVVTVASDNTQINLSLKDDQFLRENQNKTFGEVASLLSSMKVEGAPKDFKDFEAVKKKRREHEKHTKILHEISAIVDRRKLFDVWAIEKQIMELTTVARADPIIAAISEMINDSGFLREDVDKLISLLKIRSKHILHEDLPNHVPWLKRVPDCTGQTPLFQHYYQNVTYKVANRIIGLKTSEYVPLVHKLIPCLAKGQIPPGMTSECANIVPSSIIVFFLGRVYSIEAPAAAAPNCLIGGLSY